ncbi:MAG: cytochrome c peroxidase [Thermoanaerobaculia bacterium]|jgi:cytochrome c peroxidase|nr:cytochrome c peroxidase [Thermoanaerobaculia bacterium]
MTTKRFLILSAIILLPTLLYGSRQRNDGWTPAQIEELRKLSISELEPLAPDPTNRVADDPAAATLGHELFFDARLSANGKVSCASCHQPDRDSQDGTSLAHGVGTTNRRTMPIAGTAFAPFLFWDGRKDSQWAQALGPLESPVEHGGTRAQYAHVVAENYRASYEQVFGPLPDVSRAPAVGGPVKDPSAAAAWSAMPQTDRDAVTKIYANIGKAIAAYERRLQFAPSRFDRYVDTLTATGRAPENVLSDDEVAGLRLFTGKANCTQCHNGPLLTNNEFHNTGVPASPSLPQDRGRIEGAKNVLADEFNCRSRWSDATGAQCSELEFLKPDGPELQRAYKVPSLRGVAERAPYMHAGQFATLSDVLAHYNQAPTAPEGHTGLKPLKLSAQELRQIESFLRALRGGIAAPPEFLRTPVR